MNPLHSIVLIGLGNPLMSDEGIGVRIIAALVDDPDVARVAEVMDLGTGGMRMLHALKGRSKAICVDCCFMGEPPGTLRRFRPEEVRSSKVQPRLSAHEGDLMHWLELSATLGPCPEEVVIFGVQPEVVALGEKLSPALADRLDAYCAAVRKEILATTHPPELNSYE